MLSSSHAGVEHAMWQLVGLYELHLTMLLALLPCTHGLHSSTFHNSALCHDVHNGVIAFTVI